MSAYQKLYQKLYKELFDLIMGGKAFSPEADDLRRRMDNMPGSNEQKTVWGVAVGGPLYDRAVYGR